MPMIASAKSGLTIRLTEERWQHITEGHPELLHLQPEIITAYITKRINSLNKRKELWSRSP